jgi:mono/diheme cytochrome c family protein
MRMLAAAISFLAMLPAAAADEIAEGEKQYLASCAVCHGETGRGDGPAAADLAAPLPDLSLLARLNGGEFPYWKVFITIDGRYLIPGHDQREMPVWARDYLAIDAPKLGPRGGEAAVGERLHALAAYVESLQR